MMQIYKISYDGGQHIEVAGKHVADWWVELFRDYKINLKIERFEDEYQTRGEPGYTLGRIP